MPIEILMPALSPTMTEGNLVKWLKNEGDEVGAGDVIAEIETDKATMEVEAVDEGILGKILVAEGTEDVKVNTLIALLLEEDEDKSALDGMGGEASVTPAAKDVPVNDASEKAQATAELGPDSSESVSVRSAPVSSSGDAGRVFASPLARRIAQQNDIEISTLQGTGPKGRIVKVDVEKAIATGGATAVSQPEAVNVVGADELFPSYEKIKLSNMRKVIARRLTESKQQVPHFYLTIECQLDALLAARKDLNANVDPENKISVNDFVVKAMGMALRDVPEANSAWADDHVKQYTRADVSVAVAIDGGLVTPIVKGAEQKSLGAIARETKSLIQKAKEGKLKPEEFQGGTASLSNLGMFGIKEFSAVVNPPQGIILAVGAGEERSIVKDGQLSVGTVMNCTLSCDHRVVDGAVGAAFLKKFKAYITNPVLMLV